MKPAVSAPPLLYAALFEGSLGLLALLLDAFLPTEVLPRLTVSLRLLALGFLATLPVSALIPLFMRGGGPIRRIRKLLEGLLRPVAGALTVLWILILSVAAGVGEELLFRGVVQEGLGLLLGPTPGLILGAVVFGLLHAVTPTYAVYATLLGLYLGLIYRLTGSLIVPIVVHSIYDALGLWFLRRRILRLRRFGVDPGA